MPLKRLLDPSEMLEYDDKFLEKDTKTKLSLFIVYFVVFRHFPTISNPQRSDRKSDGLSHTFPRTKKNFQRHQKKKRIFLCC